MTPEVIQTNLKTGRTERDQEMTTATKYSTACYLMAFAKFPRVINAPGKYLTRGGEIVTVDTVEPGMHTFYRGSYSCGIKESWHNTGRIFSRTDSQNDIVAMV